MLAFTISEQMSCDNICGKIQNLINHYQTTNGPGSATGKVLTISIQEVTDGTVSNNAPCLELKN